MGEKKEFTYEDAMKMLYSPEAIEAAGGIENHAKIMKKWEKQERRLGIKNHIISFVEFFGVRLLAVVLIIGIMILLKRIF